MEASENCFTIGPAHDEQLSAHSVPALAVTPDLGGPPADACSSDQKMYESKEQEVEDAPVRGCLKSRHPAPP